MEDDCEVYIDSEEDEVFFGCINEREIQYFQKEKFGGRYEKGNKNIDTKKIIKDKEIVKFKEVSKEITVPLDVSEEYSFKSCNTSVEMDHNYSIHIKEKIDKSILETPRSIVKADEDGGFLKVLSEIALVKAEVENNEAAESEDENKKNKVPCIPEIKITEATPDKKEVSPCQTLEHHLRRFRIIYNSPPTNNIENKFSKKNIQVINNECNECNTQEGKKEICTEEAQNLVKNTDNVHNKKYSLPSNNSKDSTISIKSLDKKYDEPIAQCSKIFKRNPNLLDKKKEENNFINEIEDFNKLLFIEKQNSVSDDKSFHTMRNEEEQSKLLQLEQSKTVSENCVRANATFQDLQKHINDFQKDGLRNKKQIHASNSNIDNLKTSETEFKSTECLTGNVLDEISNLRIFRESGTLCKPIRFSQEVRKVVEILGKSAEDTFNSTIPEVEVNNIEGSFFSFEPASLLLSENNDFQKADAKSESKLISPCRKNNNNKLTQQFNTVEKMNFKKNSALPRNKIAPLRSFSEKKVQPVSQIKINKCVKKLPISEKKLATNKLNMKENLHFKNADFTSKIPVYGRKMVKASNLCKNVGAATGTPLKFPSEKIYKNQKFKHVISPVNAYIHNKPLYKPIEVRVKQVATENGSVKKNKPFQELAHPFMNGQNGNLNHKEKQFESRQLPLDITQKPIGLGTSKVLKQGNNFFK